MALIGMKKLMRRVVLVGSKKSNIEIFIMMITYLKQEDYGKKRAG